jgi:hypothetical protein
VGGGLCVYVCVGGGGLISTNLTRPFPARPQTHHPTPPHTPQYNTHTTGILYRQLVPKTSRDQQPDRSNAYARIACGQMADNDACIKSSVLEGLMGEYYPRLEYFTCNEAGVATPIAGNPAWFK